ncbi:MAG: hypothetical protein NC203_10495, partial [Firmicutes bacterium]|nr:hypothetical protein [Bacillota bacterium]
MRKNSEGGIAAAIFAGYEKRRPKKASFQLVEKPPFGRFSAKLTPHLAASRQMRKSGRALLCLDFKA